MLIRSTLGAALLALSSFAMAATITPSQVGNLGEGTTAAKSGFLTVNWTDSAPNIGLIQFNLSAYARDDIASATLNLYHQWNSDSGAEFGLYANTSAWTPGSGYPSDGPSFLATPVGEITISDSKTGVWRSTDLTAIVNDWTLGLLPNYGLTLQRIDDTNPYVYFASGLGGTNSPTLTLNVATVPEPADAAMLLAGVAALGALARRRNVRA